jgi:beta-lactamase regulating signal transducer with metallopeptidase domain
MSDFLADVPSVVLRTTFVLAVAAVLVRLLLWMLRPRAPLPHRLAWGCVLLQGVIVVQWSFEVPWYAPGPSLALNTVGELEPLPEVEIRAATAEQSDMGSIAPIGDAREVGWNWQSLLAVGWIAGMLATFALTFVSYALLLLSMRRAQPACGEFSREWQALLQARGVRRPIPLLLHSTVGPMLCRFPRGYSVVVPEMLWRGFTSEQRVAILLHELAHYERGDVWKSLLARLLAVPHWFNPLAWWAVRKFEEGSEWACDQQLADADPRQVPAFARALLAIIEPDSNRAFATAARGASLSVRLRRLLSFQSPEDSIMKRCLIFGILLSLLAAGAFRIQLVARAAQQDEESLVSAKFDRDADQFAERLHTDTDLLRDFRTALQTPAGKIVLQDRASFFADRLREEAQTDALPGYFNENFEKDGEGYKLRDGHERYKQEFLGTTAGFNEDVEKIGAALKELGQRVTGDSETDRLVARFMQHEAAPVMLYVQELRQRLRPDERVIEERLGEIFVANAEGKYIIRPGRRAEAEEHLRKAKLLSRALGAIHEEMKALSEEFSERDELNKRAKQLLAQPMFAAFIAAQLFDDDDGDVSRRVDNFFREFGHMAVDTADGLAIIEEEPREEIERALGEYDRIATIAPKLSRPLKAFAAKIDPSEELERGWQELLNSNVAVLKIAEEFEVASAEPAEIVRDLLGEVLDEGINGELKVRSDNQEEITEFIREMFRNYREVRRHGRVIERAAQHVADEELREAFSSTGGKYIVISSIRRSFASRDFNGLSMWVDEVFEGGDDGFVLRDGAEEDIEAFLADVRNVTEELKKDDF